MLKNMDPKALESMAKSMGLSPEQAAQMGQMKDKMGDMSPETLEKAALWLGRLQRAFVAVMAVWKFFFGTQLKMAVSLGILAILIAQWLGYVS